ncbi:hypothetical protein BT96DRAFT_1009453 [Gymnopus androsaceus JB14]|uniref:Uncharacterized protein n=1 Tax=Gymnopus androsaceus JB14 TaxID=1447944 RepID=A0A6A4GCK3_9AGAR|nr:hypothetical protein BT96DRAFT_1009453 [Gymnopus androsaceus JB14]
MNAFSTIQLSPWLVPYKLATPSASASSTKTPETSSPPVASMNANDKPMWIYTIASTSSSISPNLHNDIASLRAVVMGTHYLATKQTHLDGRVVRSHNFHLPQKLYHKHCVSETALASRLETSDGTEMDKRRDCIAPNETSILSLQAHSGPLESQLYSSPSVLLLLRLLDFGRIDTRQSRLVSTIRAVVEMQVARVLALIDSPVCPAYDPAAYGQPQKVHSYPPPHPSALMQAQGSSRTPWRPMAAAAVSILCLSLQLCILITVGILLILNVNIFGRPLVAIHLLKLIAVAVQRVPRGDRLLSATHFAIPGIS